MTLLNKKILVTGGAGYIGSTVCSALLDQSITPIILDNCYKGHRSFVKDRLFYEGDIADSKILARIFKDHPDIHMAIHCAALINVPESVAQPDFYYRENVSKSLEFFVALKKLGCSRIVFSSSASIYATLENFEATEESSILPLSPYARTKSMTEMILQDLCRAGEMKALSLRYFNPIGADPQLRSGPYVVNATHVLARMVRAAKTPSEIFEITGTDWPTRDGSGIRDYIHVWDLAEAHVKSVQNFDRIFAEQKTNPLQNFYQVINLGTGKGVTVKELVSAFEDVLKQKLNVEESPRRPGDVAGAYASSQRAKELLGWQAKLSLKDAIASALEWEKKFNDSQFYN